MRTKNRKGTTEISPKTSRITTEYDPILGFVSIDFFNPLDYPISKINLQNKFKI
jgi:hypothetical protein